MKGKYPTAATALSKGGTGVIDHPQAGQNAAFAAMSAPQCGHSTNAGAELTGAFAAFVSGRFAGLFAELFTGLFTGLDDSPSIVLLSAVFVSTVLVSAVFANAINLKSVASGHVMVLVSNFLFDFSNLLREKFD